MFATELRPRIKRTLVAKTLGPLASIAVLAQGLFASVAAADDNWPRYPTDAEIRQLGKDVATECVKAAKLPAELTFANATVIIRTVKRHDPKVIQNRVEWFRKGWPPAGIQSTGQFGASRLSIAVLVYWKVTGPSKGSAPRYKSLQCFSKDTTYADGRFIVRPLNSSLKDILHSYEGAVSLSDSFESPESGYDWKGHYTDDPRTWPPGFLVPQFDTARGRTSFNEPGFASAPPSEVVACPRLSDGPENVAVVPATDGSRALLTFSGVPNQEVRVTANSFMGMDVSLGEQGAQTFTRGTLSARTDAQGLARIWVSLRLLPELTPYDYDRRVLKAPATVRIIFHQGEGKDLREDIGEVQFGLGLFLETAKMIEVRGPDTGSILSHDWRPPPHYAWRTVVKSRFHPSLDMAEYQRSLECDPGLPKPLVNVQSIALNYTLPGDTLQELAESSPFIDGVGGLEEQSEAGSALRRLIGRVFEFSKDPKGNVYLTPVQKIEGQTYSIGHEVYPAITQRDNRIFVKGYFAFLKTAEPGEYRDKRFSFFSQASLEPRVLGHMPYVFNLDLPESAYSSLACSLEARDVVQMATLFVLSNLPGVYGQSVDGFLKVSGAICAMAREDYRGALVRLGFLFGEKALLDPFVEKELLPSLLIEAKKHPQFYRYLGVDPADFHWDDAKLLHEILKHQYQLALNTLEELNWQPPPDDSTKASPLPPSSSAAPDNRQDKLVTPPAVESRAPDSPATGPPAKSGSSATSPKWTKKSPAQEPSWNSRTSKQKK